jgi:pyruvate dehydrogenase E1 component beta subunit
MSNSKNPKTNERMITYAQALNEAIYQEMDRDSSVFVYGIENKMFGTLEGIEKKFGQKRCFSTPLSEDAMTGFGLGAAINGLRPIHTHIRIDFFLLAMNQLINMIASYHYGSAGKLNVPLVIRAVVGRGWGQGYQHSKSLQSIFAHIPGLKVIMPTTPYDAKGMLTAAIRDNGPVICIEHRWLYWQEGHVPLDAYEVEIGKSLILRSGTDLTIVSTSWMNVEAIKAAEILERHGISVEIIDPRSISPLDHAPMIESVTKTKRCIVADNDWLHCGFSGEIATRIYEYCFSTLLSPIKRIGFAEVPCPTARNLEDNFYPNAETIIRVAEEMFSLDAIDLSKEIFYSHENRFKGPF